MCESEVFCTSQDFSAMPPEAPGLPSEGLLGSRSPLPPLESTIAPFLSVSEAAIGLVFVCEATVQGWELFDPNVDCVTNSLSSSTLFSTAGTPVVLPCVPLHPRVSVLSI